MELSRYRLGDLLELSEEHNADLQYGRSDVKGISIEKIFIETKANMEGVSLNSYLLVNPDDFAYVTVTSRNGERITLARNETRSTYIVSSSYIVFRIKKKDVLLSDYLFMYFRRAEFDRYSRFHSWGSARETFIWEDMCELEIDLPDISVQQKYVDIYNAMVANQQSYERGLEDLKLVCDGYIEDLRRDISCEPVGKYLELIETKNDDLQFGIESVRGVSIEKKFMETKADMKDVNLSPYLIIQPDEFAYVPVTSRNGGKISIALNDTEDTYICSSSYTVFRSKDTEKLLPRYLMLYFSRSEFNRYARFNSWGSARETFDWSEMCSIEIPIPDIKVQKSIADIYTVYIERQSINERLKTQIKEICPILIRGSLEEGSGVS